MDSHRKLLGKPPEGLNPPDLPIKNPEEPFFIIYFPFIIKGGNVNDRHQ
jgi:hypothetical protein